MTLRTRLVPAALLTTLALIACAPEAPPAPQQTDTADTQAQNSREAAASGWSTDPADDPNAYVPTEVAADGVAVGASAGASGQATGAKPIYSTGDTVHASAAAASAATKFDAYWTFQDGQTHKMESRTGASGDHVGFTFSAADGMVPGNYNVQIDADGIPLGITEFRVE